MTTDPQTWEAVMPDELKESTMDSPAEKGETLDAQKGSEKEDELTFLDGQYKGKEAVEKALREGKQKITESSSRIKRLEEQLKELQTSQKIGEVDERVSAIQRDLRESDLAQKKNETRKQWIDRVGEDSVEFFETYSEGLQAQVDENITSLKETFQKQLSDLSAKFTGELERRDPSYVQHRDAIDSIQEKYGVSLDKAKAIYADMAKLQPETREAPPGNGNDGIRVPEQSKKPDKFVRLAETMRKAGHNVTADQLRKEDEEARATGVFV